MYRSSTFAPEIVIEKMDSTTIIGLGLSAFMLLQNKKQQEQYAQEIQSIKDDAAAQEEYIDNKLTELNTKSDEYIKNYIKVGCNLTFNEITGEKRWRGKFTWQIRNDSQDQTFVVFKEKAVFTLFGNRCTMFIPCAAYQYTIQPGQLIECSSTWQDKQWFAGSAVRSSIQDPLRDHKGEWLSDGQLIADIALKFGTIGDASTKTVMWENVKGAVRLEKGAIYSYDRAGYNGAENDW